MLWSKNSLSQKETSVSGLSNKVKNVKAGGPYQVSILVLEMLEGKVGIVSTIDLLNQITIEGFFSGEWDLTTIAYYY